MRPNVRTPDGVTLGKELARLCDAELAGKRDDRCQTCAFRSGEHLANGSPETTMTALKCAIEGVLFWCHEHDRPCAGWLALKADKDYQLEMPWGFSEGSDTEFSK